MTQTEPVVDCSKAQPLLSDLLDVRRGERPTSMESALGNPQVLEAIERHVAICESCCQELHQLKELGLAFSEFEVGEPAEGHFAGYGRIVHERIRRMTQRTVVRNPSRTALQWRTWLSAVAASAAAAVLTVVLLGTTSQTSTSKVAVLPDVPGSPSAGDGTVEEQPVAARKPEVRVHDQLAASAESIDLPKLEPRSLDINLISSKSGSQIMTFDPQPDKQLADLPDRFGQVVLGDPPQNASRSSGFVGIAFAPVSDAGVSEGLRVVAVKRGGPADAIGLRPDDRLLSLNGMTFSESSPAEILKFFNAVSNLGLGKLIQVDFARRKGSDWIVMRGKGELGKYE